MQWQFPINPSSLSRFRNRVGEEEREKILSETIKMALQHKVVFIKDLKDVIVDTTVMEKNITHPTDAKLYFRLREKLIRKAKKLNIPLRQSYTFVAKLALIDVSRYAHARQMKRAKKKTKVLRTYLRRVYADIRRKTAEDEMLKKEFSHLFKLADRLLYQKNLFHFTDQRSVFNF